LFAAADEPVFLDKQNTVLTLAGEDGQEDIELRWMKTHQAAQQAGTNVYIAA
jgi:hypothetical protein